MAYSLTLTLDAYGTVTLEATDQAGGCPYPIASKKGGDLDNLSGEHAIRKHAEGLVWIDGPLGLAWEALKPHVEDAVRALSGCLPDADVFDEEGRPRKQLFPEKGQPILPHPYGCDCNSCEHFRGEEGS